MPEKRYTLKVDGKDRTVKADVFNQNINKFVNDLPDATIMMFGQDGSTREYRLRDISDAYDAGYSFLETNNPIYVNSKPEEAAAEAQKVAAKPAVVPSTEQEVKNVGSKPYTGQAVNAEGGYVFTEAGLDSLEKGAVPVAVDGGSRSQREELTKEAGAGESSFTAMPSPLQPEEEKVSLRPFADKMEEMQRLSESPELNQYWADRQREAERRIANPGASERGIAYTMEGIEQAQEAEVARKMNRSKYDQRHFDDFYEKSVAPVFSEERKEGGERAKAEADAFPGSPMPGTVGGYFGKAVAYEKYTDPEKIANATLQRVEKDDSFGDYVMQRMGIDNKAESDDGARVPQLSDREQEYIKRLYAQETNEVADKIVQKIYEQYQSENAPQGTLDYILGKAFHENLASSLGNAIVRRAAHSSGMREQLRAMASEAYGRDQNWGVRAAGAAAPFAVDMVAGGFALPNFVGEAIVKGGTRLAAKQLVGEMTSRAASRGVTGAAMKEVTQGAEKVAERYLATNAPIVNLAIRSAGSATNFATYDMQNEVVRQIADGEFRPFDLIKEAVHGAVLGGVMGGVGGAIGHATRNASRLGKIAGGVAGLGAETAIFGVSNGLAKAQANGEDISSVDWADTMGEAFGQVVGMKTVGAVMHPREFVNRYRKSKDYDLQLNQRDIDELKQAGYDLDGVFKGLGKFGKFAPQSATLKDAAKEYSVDSEGVGHKKETSSESAWVDADAYESMMRNPEVRSETKRKVAYIATGKVLMPEPAFGVILNEPAADAPGTAAGYSVTTLNAYGMPIYTKDYKSKEDAEKDYKQLQETVRTNTIGGLESIADRAGFPDVKDEAKGRTKNETGVDVDDLEQLANFTSEQASAIFDAYIKNLQEAYMERFNEKLKRLGGREGGDDDAGFQPGQRTKDGGLDNAGGKAGRKEAGGNEPPAAPPVSSAADASFSPAADASFSPAADAAGTAAGDRQERLSRREAAYERGASVKDDSGVLPGINYDVKLADARLAALFPASDTQASRLRTAIMDAVESGDDDSADRIIAEAMPRLTGRQADALEQYRDMMEVQRGVEDAVTQQTEEFEEQRRAELEPLTAPDGRITPLELTDGTTVYYKTGDLQNKYGGVMVATSDGQQKQIPTSSIRTVGESEKADNVLDSDIEDFANAIREDYRGITNGGIFIPGVKVDLVLGGKMFNATIAGQDAAGNPVFTLEDGSQIPLSKSDARQSINAADDMKIQAQLKQESDAAESALRTERFTNGIKGYADGKPDYSAPESKADVVAEYLLSTIPAEEANGRERLLKNIQGEKDLLSQNAKQASEEWQRAQNVLLMSDDDAVRQAKAIQDIRGAELRLQDIDARQRKWGEIRQALMNDKERQQLMTERTKAINKARTASIKERDAQPDADATGVMSGMAVIPTSHELLNQYQEQGEAENAVDVLKKETVKIWRDDLFPRLDEVRKQLADYQNGLIEFSDDELKPLTDALVSMEAEESALVVRQKQLKQLGSGLGRLYASRNNAVLSSHEKKVNALGKTQDREKKLKLAREAYSEDPMASAMLDDDSMIPQDVYEVVAANLGYGSISWEGYDRGGHHVRGLQEELGKHMTRGLGKDSDTFGFNTYLAPAGKGKGIDEVVHDIYEAQPDADASGTAARYDTEEIKNALLDMLMSAKKPTDISNRIIDDRIGRAEEVYKSNYERDREAEEEAKREAEDAAIMEMTGMSPEEYDAFISDLEQRLAEQEGYKTSEEYFNQIAEYNDRENERSAGGSQEEGALAEQREKGEPSGVEAADEGGTGAVAAVENNDQPIDYTKGEELTHIPFAERLRIAKSEVFPNPTEEQKKAGNYKMGHIRFGGYRMSIENPKGSVRSGVDKSGRPWSITMQDTYGYIGRKYGADGDHLDFFINDDADLDNWNGYVYIVDQKNEDGTFDEHKVMYGYPYWIAAKEAYERNYEPGWWDKHVMQMMGAKKDRFDKWLSDSDHKRKPYAEYFRLKYDKPVSDPVSDVLAQAEERKKHTGEAQGASTKSRIEQQEIGYAMVDRLENMGFEVSTDPQENRRVRKIAEKDQSDAGKMRHFKTPDGKIYGFVYKGKMYLDPSKIDAELPIHEYAHPWCEAFRKFNSDGWRRVVDLMKSDEEAWKFVKSLNPDLDDEDDIAEEMIAKFSGKKGAERARAEYERMNGRDPNYKSKWANIWNNISKAIQDFWKQIGDFLHIKYESVEQVYDQVVKDFANKINPRKLIEDWLKERDASYLKAVESGDESKAKELFDEALRENIGNGMTPFVAASGYTDVRRLAHGVKSRDPKVIAEVADLMEPIIPKDAVLVPAPSHSGEATDMLDLARALSERTGAPVADVLKSGERGSQYEAKKAGKPLSATELGISIQGELPKGKLPVVIDNVVDTGNTAEACVRALGKGVVASLAESVDRYKHVASLKSAEPVVVGKDGKVVPLSQRFEIGGKYLEKANTTPQFTTDDMPQFMIGDGAAVVSMPRINQYGLNENTPLGRKLTRLKKEAGEHGLVGYTDPETGDAVFMGKDADTVYESGGLRSIQTGIHDGMTTARVRAQDIDIVSPRLVRDGYKLVLTDDTIEDEPEEKSPQAPNDAVDQMLQEVERRQEKADKKEADAIVGEYLKSNADDTVEADARKRATKAVLRAMDKAGVPYKVVSKAEEKEMLKVFSLSNQEAVKEFARRMRKNPMARYAVYNMEDPFGLPMYAEKQSVAKWILKGVQKYGGDWSVLDIGYADDAATMLEHNGTDGTRKAADMNVGELRTVTMLDDGTVIEFMVDKPAADAAGTTAPVFVSNALKAVEGIKQEKATAEQWLAMIQKTGGLKAGEDKWVGLSDLLNGRKGQSLTKQDLLEYIRENQVEVEDVNYGLGESEKREVVDAFNEEFQRLQEEAYENDPDVDVDEQIRYAWDEMCRRYGAGGLHGFNNAFRVDEYGRLEIDDLDEAVKLANEHKGTNIGKPINSTRLDYTTQGLQNKREIALVVPTVEPWNESDEIHFGDAGGGRAVAWVRFGEAKIPRKDPVAQKAFDDAQKAWDDFSGRMYDKYGASYTYHLNDEEQAENKRLSALVDNARQALRQANAPIRVLVIDEIQSKRHQEGREKGYKNADLDKKIKRLDELNMKMSSDEGLTNEEYEELQQLRSEGVARASFDVSGVPDAPFDKNWHELAMKRMLRYAAENGYDKVAWTKGEQQAERYDIGNVVNKIISYDYPEIADPDGRKTKKIEIRLINGDTMTMRVDADGKVIEGRSETEGKNLSDVVGKDLAVRIMGDEGKNGTIYDANRDLPAKIIEGDGLRIGGEGMKGFYDQMLPRFMDKYGKKWGVKTGEIDLPALSRGNGRKGVTMWRVDVTPEMKESVMEGQPMFQKEGQRILGWSDGKQVYLTEAGLNPNTPIHECTHLWDKWLQKEKPELWKKVVASMKKTAMWDEVRKNPDYRNIWEDEDRLASEVHSRLSGAASEEEFMKAAFTKDTPQKIIDEVKSVLRKFWEAVLRMFGKMSKSIGDEWNSLDAIVKMPLRDLLNQDFEKVIRLSAGARDEKGGKMYRHVTPEVAKANSRFNEELERQINDPDFPKDHVYKLGKPGAILLSTGFPNDNIELSASHLLYKSRTAQHPFELKDVKDLVKSINDPIAVFGYGDKNKSQNVIVELDRYGKKFMVGIHFKQGYRGTEISDIRGIFPRDNSDWINWIGQGKHLYLDKEKIQNLIAQQRRILAEVSHLDLNSVAKILNSFENPKLSDEKLQELFADYVDAGEETADELGGVKVKYESEGVGGGTLGWYDPNDHSVHVVLPEHGSADEVKRTVCHEKLGHEGLAALFLPAFRLSAGSRDENQGLRISAGTTDENAGARDVQDEVNKFGVFIFRNAGKALRKRILDKADDEGYGWDDPLRLSKAAQEVFADIAADGPATSDEFSLWDKVKHYLIKTAKKLNLRVNGLLNDHDLRYYVLKTGEALKRWNQMSETERENISALSTNHEIMRSRRGKPRKRNDESMAQYIQRLREWEKWKIADEQSKAAGDPMPDEDAIDKKWEERFDADMKAWREANGIPTADAAGTTAGTTAADAAGTAAGGDRGTVNGPGEFPKRKEGESPQEYALRVAEHETLVDTWKGAPNYFDYLQRAQAEYREQYASWKARYNLDEAENVDMALYEGETLAAPHTDQEIEAEARLYQDMAQAVGVALDSDGARRQAKMAVIERRKNLESSNAEDAIWLYNLHKKIDAAAKSMSERTGNKVTGDMLREALPFIIEGTYWKDVIRNANGDVVTVQDISDQLPIKKGAELDALLSDIKEWYDEFYQALEDAGLRYDAGYISEGYVNHVWDKDKSDPKAWEEVVENYQRTKSPNMRHREIETYQQGIDLGLVPKYKDICDILAYYSRQNNEAIANKKFLEDLSFLVVEELNSDGEVVANWPLLDSSKPSFGDDKYEMYHVPGVGDVWVLKDVQKRFATIFGTMRTKDAADWLSKVGKAYDLVGSTAKKIQLALSGFHALALWEVDVAQSGPIAGLHDLFKYIVMDSYRKGWVFPAYAHPEDFKFAAKHLVQLGATEDYAASDVNAITAKFREAVRELRLSAGTTDERGQSSERTDERGLSAMAKTMAGYAATPLAVMMDWINKGFDTVLWNYLHDGLKIASFKRFAEQIDRRLDRLYADAEHRPTENRDELRERLLDEAGQYVNDMFGGQYWELLNVSPATLKWLRRAFLSPDWLISTQRHFLANFGIGSLYNEGGFVEYMRYNADNLKRLFGKDMVHNEERRFRSRNAKICYLVGALFFWQVIYNALNALNRLQDEQREAEKSDEIRKEHPDYKSPYELAYPDGMKWYDYTMWGNSLGQQTHLFTGRYKDGTETYVRWGKQFREFPELFIGKHGFELPTPILERMESKTNPVIGGVMDLFGSLDVRGFEESYQNKELREKYGKEIAAIATTARHFMPFGIPTQSEKEYKWLDFFMPSSKGFSRYKAVDYFKTFILAGDMRGVEQTYKAAVMNGVDAEKCLESAISTLKATQRKDLSDGIVDLQSAMEAFDQTGDVDNTTYRTKANLRNKIIKYLAEDKYHTFTREEAVEKVDDWLGTSSDFDNPDAGNDTYLMLMTSSDVRDDYRLSAIGKQAKTYVDKVKTCEDPQTRAQMAKQYGAWFAINGMVNKARNSIGKLKGRLGKGDDAEVMRQIRQIRQQVQSEIDHVEAPK